MDNNSVRDPLNALTTADVLKAEGLTEHERLKTALWDHLVRLENNVTVLEDLVSFPASKMLGASRKVVDWFGQNLYEYTIIIAWRLWCDDDARAVTLKQLRQLLHEHVRDQHREALYRRLKHLRPSAAVRDVFNRAGAVRHGRLAHIDKDYTFDDEKRVAGISIAELRTATDFLAAYFNGLQMGVHSFLTLPSFERNPEGRSGTVAMLENLVVTAPYSRRYEERGPAVWWRTFGANLTPDEVAWLSAARVRSGRTPIQEAED